MFSFNVSGSFSMPGTAIIGGEPPVELSLYPHVDGKPLPYFGCFTTEDGMNGMVFLDDEANESWSPEGAANAVLLEGGEAPGWVTFQEVDEEDAIVVLDDEVELEFDPEPHWIQGDETPEGFDFLFEVPSNTSPDLNIGDGYGTAYVFVRNNTEGRIVWQS